MKLLGVAGASELLLCCVMMSGDGLCDGWVRNVQFIGLRLSKSWGGEFSGFGRFGGFRDGYVDCKRCDVWR